MMPEINLTIEYQHIHQRFGKREILNDITVRLQQGEVVLLTGDNGSGKSTLLRIMAGLLKPDSGNVVCVNEPGAISHSRKTLLKEVMYLHQTPYLFDGSVKKNLLYALNKGREDRAKQVDQALEWVGLEHLAEENAKTLSGGERQRIALARALLRRPRFLLLDEPTAHLDAISSARISNLLLELKSRSVSMLIASHEPFYLGDLIDVEYKLENGRLFLKTAATTF
jgi:tungstate transport system ATP-binding protein